MTTPILAMSLYWPVILYIAGLIFFVMVWPVKPWARPDYREDDPNYRISKEEE